ncbi:MULTISPECIES: AAA family ATPase [Streptomyces]|uniref:AAA family ATPase n=1 Tax=Streptomyces TaxID=1883 RepID=UPI0033A4AC17
MDKLTAHWGFTRMPFGKARITWCIGERALGVITGEVGAGKTVAVRASLSQLDHPRHKVIYLANPAVGVAGIHHAIVASLGGVPRPHKSTLIPQPPTCWPPRTTNAAASPS